MNFYNCHISSTGIRPIVYSVRMAYITFLLEVEHLHETKSWQKFQHIARPPSSNLCPFTSKLPWVLTNEKPVCF